MSDSFDPTGRSITIEVYVTGPRNRTSASLILDTGATVTVDGLLGLDFLRGRVLTLDFARGRAGLRAPRWWWPW